VVITANGTLLVHHPILYLLCEEIVIFVGERAKGGTLFFLRDYLCCLCVFYDFSLEQNMDLENTNTLLLLIGEKGVFFMISPWSKTWI